MLLTKVFQNQNLSVADSESKRQYLSLRAEGFHQAYQREFYTTCGDEYDADTDTAYIVTAAEDGTIVGGMRILRSPRGSEKKLRYEAALNIRVTDFLPNAPHPCELDYFEFSGIIVSESYRKMNISDLLKLNGFEHIRNHPEIDFGIGYLMPMNLGPAIKSALKHNMPSVIHRRTLRLRDIDHRVILYFPGSIDMMSALLDNDEACTATEFLKNVTSLEPRREALEPSAT